jgi:hypothetical protein
VLHSLDTALVGAAALALAMLTATASFHHGALRVIARAIAGRRVTRHWVVFVLAALVGTHLVEIALYAGAFAIGANVLDLGALHGSSGNARDFFYFAAETYSTLGYGDLVPVGALRLVASVEALNGLMLLSWSGAFLFGVLDSDRQLRRER